MNLPSWALRTAVISDREVAKKAHKNGHAKVAFKDRSTLRRWMEYQGWKTSWLFLEDAFYKELFDNDAYFHDALSEGIVEIMIPKTNYAVPQERLQEIDKDYASNELSYVVSALRDIRRAIEAGVQVEIDGNKLNTWDQFYTWAHGRYHRLEDGADKWIGDDK